MDTSYTPLQNPDLSVLDPSTVGVDSTITTQTINSQLSPFSLDSYNTLNINKVASFASDITVGGVINNTDLQNKLSNKSSKISTAPATIVLGQSSDIVYFVNENSVSYPLDSSNDISFSRNNNNILLNITQDFKDLYVLSSSLSSTLSSYITSSGLTSALSSYAPLANPIFTGTVSGITKAMVGLANVDNTSDASKPVSTATQTALDLKANSANPTFTGTVSGITKAMVGLANVDNTSDASKPVSTATQTALDLKANLASPSFTGTPTIGTNAIAVKPWVSGRFGGVSSGNPNITGTASNVGTGSGVQSFTVTRQSAGTYNVNWTTAHPSGSSYTILVSVRGAFTCSYGVPASTSFQIYTYSVGTSTLADPTAGDISFTVLQ